MSIRVVFLRVNRSVVEAELSAQPKSNTLQNTVPLHAHRQTEFKEEPYISHVPNDQSLFHL